MDGILVFTTIIIMATSTIATLPFIIATVEDMGVSTTIMDSMLTVDQHGMAGYEEISQ